VGECLWPLGGYHFDRLPFRMADSDDSERRALTVLNRPTSLGFSPGYRPQHGMSTLRKSLTRPVSSLPCYRMQKVHKLTDIIRSAFEDHSLWHTQRQAQLKRRPRNYQSSERPRSATVDQTGWSHSDGSVESPAASATTLGSPPRRSHSQQALSTVPITVDESSIIPEFDFNFDTISPLAPVASCQSLSIIKTLEDVVARFPAFEIDESDDQSHRSLDYKCADCEAVFSTQRDCDLHNQSKFCPGSAAIAYALYRDMRRPGGYRIDTKYLPFNGQKSSIKCSKCHLSFPDRVSKKVHERSHPAALLECLHCQKMFSTNTELESHYQWHDDMEYRHHRNRCRRKLPGLKLQAKPLQKRSSRAGVADFGRKSVFLADDELAVIPEDVNEEPEEPGM
jgi:hypothetical protein